MSDPSNVKSVVSKLKYYIYNIVIGYVTNIFVLFNCNNK